MDIDFNNRPLVVIVDDEREILAALKRCFMRIDIRIESFTSPHLALRFIRDNQPAIVISDQRMPDISGNELLAQVKIIWPTTTRIMLSAYQDFDSVSAGFNDDVIQKFIAKPWHNGELILLVEDALGVDTKKVENNKIAQQIISHSDVMQELLDKVQTAAGANVPIFIHGETGTGKELIAKACHQFGCRRAGKFIAVNCANFSDTLIESQLFGHKKGAFTGAIADQEGLLSQCDGGTLFLDEITTLPLPLQAKLLRVIQERQFSPVGVQKLLDFDAQIVTASSVKLSEALSKKEFREDLYYRLNVIPLNIPALRARGNDTIVLAEYFLSKFSKEHGKQFKNIASEAKQLIRSFAWPGNVRQLENTMHSAVILNNANTLTLEMLQALISEEAAVKSAVNIHSNTALANNEAAGSPVKELSEAVQEQVIPLEDVERHAIERAISLCDGNVTKAAAMLEVNPSTIYRKMQKWS